MLINNCNFQLEFLILCCSANWNKNKKASSGEKNFTLLYAIIKSINRLMN